MRTAHPAAAKRATDEGSGVGVSKNASCSPLGFMPMPTICPLSFMPLATLSVQSEVGLIRLFKSSIPPFGVYRNA
jgi:hypothetical protein